MRALFVTSLPVAPVLKMRGQILNMKKLLRLPLICSLLTLSLGLSASDVHGQKNAVPEACPAVGDAGVITLLVPVREKFDVPAMAMAVVTSEGIKYVGAVGVRKRGSDTAVALGDLWHLGSCTKAMTATMIAQLVERGRLKWDTTLADYFPEFAGQMDPAYRKITLSLLLSHRSGLPANLNLMKYRGDDVTKLRLQTVSEYLATKPESAPGSRYLYSNLGYVIAGAILEKASGKSWEQYMTEELFRPLHMSSAGFGGTGTPGKIDQPWPHFSNGEPASTNGPTVDNPPVYGPPGRVHCTIQDWAKFIQDQLRGTRGESALLKAQSYESLVTPPAGNYAFGWFVLERAWAGGRAFNHVGDNTMNCADVWIAPKKDFAILVCVNQGGDKALQASDAAVAAMLELLSKQQGL